MRMITACFARALRKYTGRPYLGFLFIFQAVRPTDKTCSQLNCYKSSVHASVQVCTTTLDTLRALQGGAAVAGRHDPGWP
jgi:hypothetical protein